MSEDKDREDSRKKRRLILAIILVIVIILGIVVFFVTRGSKGGDETPPPSPSTSTTQIKPSQEEQGTPGDYDEQGDGEYNSGGGEDGSVLGGGGPSTKVPTTARNPNNHGDPVDPSQGTPQMLAKNFLQQMMTLDIEKNNSYSKSFDSFAPGRVTKTKIGYGFPRWYEEGEHSFSWNNFSGQGARLYTFPERTDSKYFRNNVVKVSFTGTQRIYQGDFTVNLPKFRASVYMKYVDGKWLVDEITFPAKSRPTIY